MCRTLNVEARNKMRLGGLKSALNRMRRREEAHQRAYRYWQTYHAMPRLSMEVFNGRKIAEAMRGEIGKVEQGHRQIADKFRREAHT